MRVSTWSGGTGSSGGMSSPAAMRCSACASGLVPASAEPSPSRVSNRIMPAVAHIGVELFIGLGIRRRRIGGDRPVDEREEGEFVLGHVHRHRGQRLDRGPLRQLFAQTLQPGARDRVDRRVAGEHIGEHHPRRRLDRPRVGGRGAGRDRDILRARRLRLRQGQHQRQHHPQRNPLCRRAPAQPARKPERREDVEQRQRSARHPRKPPFSRCGLIWAKPSTFTCAGQLAGVSCIVAPTAFSATERSGVA